MDPRSAAQTVERAAAVPAGEGDRTAWDSFAGYSIIGQPFRSGHVLALRRFPASSLGPAYTSVWHRDPAGRWTFYSTVPPDLGCTRYFAVAVNRDVVTPIELKWLGPMSMEIVIPGTLTWKLTFTASWATRTMNWMVAKMPESWGRNRVLLKAMSAVAGALFDAGHMSLAGRTPSGNQFFATPGAMWLVQSSKAIVRGYDLGEPGPLEEQARLRDVWIPQRGMFAVTRAFLQAS